MSGSWLAIPMIMVLAQKNGDDDATRLAEIRERGLSSVRLIHSMEFSYQLKRADGWIARAHFLAMDGRFRVDREDVTGITVGKTRFAPRTYITAFDNKKQQIYNDATSLLRVKQGALQARYGIETPQTLAYAWFWTADGALRWDEFRNSSLWQKRFADAVYIGATTEDGQRFEVVDFPFPLKSPCVMRVSFASDLGYVPLKYQRRVKSTGVVAAWMRVDRHKVLEIDGNRVAFPLEISDGSTGLDNLVPKQEESLVVDESSLKVNHKVDEDLFTIPKSVAKRYRDSDEVGRRLREARQAVPGQAPPPGRTWPSTLFIGVNAVILLCIIPFIIMKFKKSAKA